MIINIYAIKDAKADAFLNPFFKPNDAMAERDFANACADENSMFARNPEDFQIYHIGEFDDESAEVKPSLVKLIASGIDYATLGNEA